MGNIRWDHEQPAVVFLREQVTIYLPEVALNWAAMTNTDKHYHGPRVHETHRLHGVGGYKPRSTEFGNPSLHSYGRAADIYVNTRNPLLRAIGDALFAGFIDNALALGVDHVIWNGQIWSAEHPRILHYHGKERHGDHVHVAFTVDGSQRRSPALVSLLKGISSDVDRQFPLPKVNHPALVP
jgi:hypothetical protein